MIKIVAIGGSLRPFSITYQILVIMLKKIEARGASTQLIDLREMHLPFCHGGSDYSNFPQVDYLRDSIQTSSGLLIATPEYHGGLSGILKNAIDLIEEEHISGKAIGLISVLGGLSSANALNMMRVVFRHLHCWVLPQQVIIPNSQTVFDAQGHLIDEELNFRLEQLVDHLLNFVYKLKL